jgi:hypothetical protein
MTILLFTVALALSAVAAWYAIAGLVAIFAAAAIPIMIMGSLLEAAKLVVASWLYRSWNEIPKLFKAYFLSALIVLMLLTSMGIFGFLSKAHLDQAVPTGDAVAKLEIIDDKIKTQKENIDVARRTISQLDRQVEETLNRTANDTTNSGVNRSVTIRRQQANERATLAKEIESAQTEISKLTQERIPFAQEVRKIEAEVGPIKYIAALIYGDNPNQNLLESAVRIVILLIVFVFDPLAVLLLVAANWQQKKDSGNKIETKEEVKNITIEDNVSVQEKTEFVKEQEDQYQKVFKEAEETEIPEIHVDEPTKDWEPKLYDRKIYNTIKKKIEYDSAGRRVTPTLEEELHPPSKTQSFLTKVQESLSLGIKTIEKEVDELQRGKDPK